MLYLDHFGLDEPPFRITPHTDFFFDGADRGATLEALLYAILHDEGIVKVSGEVGSGKTMLCRVLMERLPEHVEIVYLATPSLARDDILYAIADDLRVEFSQGRITAMLRDLLEHLIDLYADGRRVVILIDEAHAMPEDTLEQVRLLSNLESNRHKLLQIVLFGQPELDAVLDQASMRQLKDRITHSFRMRPLSRAEIGKYLSFRMRAAGYRGPDVFSPKAVSMIAKSSDGLTRRVNILADKALLAAFTENTHAVSERQARAAIRDSDFGRLLNERGRHPVTFAVAALIVGLALGAAVHWMLARNPAGEPLQTGALQKTPSGNAGMAVPKPEPSPSAAPTILTNEALASKEGPPSAPSAPAMEPAGHSTTTHRPDPLPGRTDPPLATASATLLLAPEALRRVSSYGVDSNKLVRQRIAATLERLQREPDASFSIELFVTENSDPARVQRFLLRARDQVALDEIYVLPQANGEKYRIRVTFGSFPDRETAEKAVERLPPKYRREFQTALRSFAELRASL